MRSTALIVGVPLGPTHHNFDLAAPAPRASPHAFLRQVFPEEQLPWLHLGD
jgi:hypothetical protein